ncbi:MAG: amidohydrolase family protein [Planctomycetota bacterium]
MNRREWLEELEDAVRSVGVVDAHHHMISPGQRAARKTGLIDFLSESYLAADLKAAGLDWTALAPLDDASAWEAIRKLLPFVRFTSYFRVVDTCFRDLLGLRGPLWEVDWRALDEKLKAGSADENWTVHILRSRVGLTHGVLDRQATGTTNLFLRGGAPDWYDFILRERPRIPDDTVLSSVVRRDSQPPLWTPSVKIDALLWGYVREARTELEALYHVPVPDFASLDDYLSYVDRCFEKMKEEGVVALKSAFAGVRRIDYQPVDRAAAEALFPSSLKPQVSSLKPDHARAFEDFMIGHLAERSADFALPFQFHTGTPFSGPVSDSDTRCDHLTGLISRHPRTRFVLMHGGFPYTRELANLAKRFPNVYVDISWLPMLSESASEQAIAELITLAPCHKLVWGGDCVFAEETYGAFKIALESLAGALARLIDSDQISRPDALSLAPLIFSSNPRNLFSLPSP